MPPSNGLVAQLGERYNRTVEVRGSNPLRSTKIINPLTALILELTPSPQIEISHSKSLVSPSLPSINNTFCLYQNITQSNLI